MAAAKGSLSLAENKARIIVGRLLQANRLHFRLRVLTLRVRVPECVGQSKAPVCQPYPSLTIRPGLDLDLLGDRRATRDLRQGNRVKEIKLR